MSYVLTDSLKRELGLAQALFCFAKEQLTDPLRNLSGFLSAGWLSMPSKAYQAEMVTILEICLPNLKAPFEGDYVSCDPRHLPLQKIQESLSSLKNQNNSHELNNYFNLVCALLNVMMAMDAEYKSKITHVDELEHAKLIAKTAEEKAKSHGVKIVITILDKSAQLVLLYRMHGALLISTDVAVEKAKSAILMQMPSGDIRALVQPGAEFEGLQNTRPGICILDGGFPMYAGARLIGSIGISGSTSALDIAIATHAIQENYLSIKPEGACDD